MVPLKIFPFDPTKSFLDYTGSCWEKKNDIILGVAFKENSTVLNIVKAMHSGNTHDRMNNHTDSGTWDVGCCLAPEEITHEMNT